MWLSFEALDVWFFRDGRPFDAGDAHRARSQFPPPAETLRGAIRAILIESRFGSPRTDSLSVDEFLDWLHRLPRTTGGGAASVGKKAYVDTLAELGAGAEAGAKLDVTGPFVLLVGVATGNEAVVLIAPRDLLQQESGHLVTLTPMADAADAAAGPLAGVKWNSGLPVPNATGKDPLPPRPVPLVTTVQAVEDLKGTEWITVAMMETYLEGGAVVKPAPDLVTPEQRAGIAIGPERVVRSGFYYEIDVIRPRTERGETRILAKVTPPPDHGRAWRLPFGGEGKTALVTAVEDTDPAAMAIDDLLSPNGASAMKAKGFAAQSGWLRVVLLQPAIFDRGWLPDVITTADGAVRTGGYSFTLRAAAVGKPGAVSGWDLRQRKAKPLRRAAPAGSVYYFEIDTFASLDAAGRDAAATAFWAAFHGKSTLQDDPARGRAGYGLAVAGACEPRRGSLGDELV